MAEWHVLYLKKGPLQTASEPGPSWTPSHAGRRWRKKADEVQQIHQPPRALSSSSVPSRQCNRPAKPSITPLLSADGALLKEKNAIIERWEEHFCSLLNRLSNVSRDTLDQIPQSPMIDSLDRPTDRLPSRGQKNHQPNQLRKSSRNRQYPCGHL